jgi:hypothetical protein
MRKIAKWLLLLVAFLLSPLFGKGTHAQTYTASNCNDTGTGGVQATVNTALASGLTTVTVIVPSCPGGVAWGTGVSLTVPSTFVNFTIEGQSTIATTNNEGNPATFNDNTLINCTVDQCLTIITSGSYLAAPPVTVVRLTGISFGPSSGLSHGVLKVQGNSTGLVEGTARVDHNHFMDYNGGHAGYLYDVVGVADHNLFDTVASSDNGLAVEHQHWNNDSTENGNGSWATPANLGSSGFFFLENNSYNNSYVNDCNDGGREVFRYNTITNAIIQTHRGVQGGRGCPAGEYYHNVFYATNGNTGSGLFIESGTYVSWGNVMNFTGGTYGSFNELLNDRRTSEFLYAAPPNDLGNCGTTSIDSLASLLPNGPSNWDGNSTIDGTPTDGYPCLDNIGRGQGDLVTGQVPPYGSGLCDTTSGQCASSNYHGSFTHEFLQPVYEWMDTFNGGSPTHGVMSVYDNDTTIANNRDYYAWCNSASINGCTSFNGTQGVGSGLFSARPSTCTAGPGGTYGVSPTGSYGVAYWATDQNSLYVCTATNTWANYYTPYAYPHPLTQSSSSGPLPAAPTNLTAVVQ